MKEGGVLFIANEALPKEDDERQKYILELLDMNIYSKDELEKSLRKAGFKDITSHVKESTDSFTGDDADWICIIAKK